MIIIGPLTFHLYGLLIGLGILVGAVMASRVSKVKLDDIFDYLIWVVGFGLVGARLYHVISFWSYYSVNFREIMMVWKGGMGIFGGILGGVVGGWLYIFNKETPSSLPAQAGFAVPTRHSAGSPIKESPLTSRADLNKFFKMLDVGAIGLPIGQAIGRWGNYFNQELYGKPTELPWGIFIKPENRLIEVIDFEKFHPLFLYESILNLVIFLILRWLVKSKRVKIGKGRLFVCYLGLYGLVRFFLEFLKIETWMIGSINVVQVISLGLVGLSLTVLKHKEIISLDDKSSKK